MGTIKDLVDLVTQLNSSVTDRKFAGELREIQSMIASLQSEHADIHEKRIDLLEENANLRQQVATLKEEIILLKQHKEESTSQEKKSSELSEEEQEILKCLAKTKYATAGSIASLLNRDNTRVEFWTSRLCDLEMIGFTLNLNGPTEYYLQQDGREYLINNELI